MSFLKKKNKTCQTDQFCLSQCQTFDFLNIFVLDVFLKNQSPSEKKDVLNTIDLSTGVYIE